MTFPPKLALRTRLQIARLQLLLAIVKSRAFARVIKWTVRPIALGWLVLLVIRLAFGYTPTRLAAIHPDVAHALADLDAARNKPIRTEITDRQYASLQAMTWGTSGAALVLEAAIATSSKPLGPGMSVAAGCFAVVIPVLVACGFVQSGHYHPDKDHATTVQQSLNLSALIYGTQLAFCIGLASMLYDFNPVVAIAFLVGCILALRIIRRFAALMTPSLAKVTNPEEPIVTEKMSKPEPGTKTNVEVARDMLKGNAYLSGAAGASTPKPDRVDPPATPPQVRNAEG
jgi:hypothetical protein